MNTSEAVAAAVEVAAPLVSKEEHILGEKILRLVYRWGDEVLVTVRALGYRELKKISQHITANNLSHDDNVELITRASTKDQDSDIFNKLDVASAALLERTALAMSLGESAVKNVQRPATTATPAQGIGLATVGERSANSLPQVGYPAKPEAIPQPSLQSSTPNSPEPKPATT